MSTAPDLPGSLYGLRSWRAAKGDDGECLTVVVHGPRWPAAGEWLGATCEMGGGHAAPQADCTCGRHALHPRLASARRVMSARGQVAGVMEAAGRVEVHVDGLRAERARVHALA